MSDITFIHEGICYDLTDIMRYIFELQNQVRALENKLEHADIQYLP